MIDREIHVSLVAVSDALVGPVTSIYESLGIIAMLKQLDANLQEQPSFRVEIIGADPVVTCEANGLSIPTHRRFHEVDDTDLVIIASMMPSGLSWPTGRHPEAVDWLSAMHGQGARLCGACTGSMLLAETGLLDGWEATVHPSFAPAFREHFPDVSLQLESVLIASGRHGELVTSGAAAGWHDMLLYLVSQHASPALAQAMCRFLLLQWHEYGQGPYLTFSPATEHGDMAIARTQEWLSVHYAEPQVLETLCQIAGLTERSFKRRFRSATGYSPICYVQQLRVEEAKRKLERTNDPVDEIAYQVGYENIAFFRRVFKRFSGVTPSIYRRRFRVPEVATPSGFADSTGK